MAGRDGICFQQAAKARSRAAAFEAQADSLADQRVVVAHAFGQVDQRARCVKKNRFNHWLFVFLPATAQVRCSHVPMDRVLVASLVFRTARAEQ